MLYVPWWVQGYSNHQEPREITIFKCTLYYEKIKQDKFQLSLPEKNNNKKEERTQINKIRNETGQITTNTTEIEKTHEEHCEQLYANKLENLEEMDIFPETYSQKENIWV